MRTLTFQSVLEDIGGALGIEVGAAAWTAAMQAKALASLYRRVRQAWAHEFWDELTPVELRAYRLPYASGTTYAAPTLTAASEVYDPPSDAYYQALRATTGNAPTTLSGGVWTVNAAYWALCTTNPGAPADWLTGTVYAVGAQVRNPADGRAYQCHTAHTAGGSFDATKFGVLTPFRQYIARDQAGQTPIGEVDMVSAYDPRVASGSTGRFAAGGVPYAAANGPGRIDFRMSADGIVPVTTRSRVWVRFRLPPSVFTLALYNNATTYAVGALVYDKDATGECYRAIASTTGNAVTDPAHWAVVPFPMILAEMVTHGVAADLYRGEGQPAEAAEEDSLALGALARADDEQFASQGQFSTAQARTY